MKRGFPGMKSVKDLPILQDSPPPGGFPAVRIERRLPSTGPTGATIFGLVIGCMSYGYYRYYRGYRERQALQAEVAELQAGLFPVLQAESDLRYAAWKRGLMAAEAETMKNVPGWTPKESTAIMGRFIPPMPPIGVNDHLIR